MGFLNTAIGCVFAQLFFVVWWLCFYDRPRLFRLNKRISCNHRRVVENGSATTSFIDNKTRCLEAPQSLPRLLTVGLLYKSLPIRYQNGPSVLEGPFSLCRIIKNFSFWPKRAACSNVREKIGMVHKMMATWICPGGHFSHSQVVPSVRR